MRGMAQIQSAIRLAAGNYLVTTTSSPSLTDADTGRWCRSKQSHARTAPVQGANMPDISYGTI